MSGSQDRPQPWLIRSQYGDSLTRDGSGPGRRRWPGKAYSSKAIRAHLQPAEDRRDPEPADQIGHRHRCWSIVPARQPVAPGSTRQHVVCDGLGDTTAPRAASPGTQLSRGRDRRPVGQSGPGGQDRQGSIAAGRAEEDLAVSRAGSTGCLYLDLGDRRRDVPAPVELRAAQGGVRRPTAGPEPFGPDDPTVFRARGRRAAALAEGQADSRLWRPEQAGTRTSTDPAWLRGHGVDQAFGRGSSGGLTQVMSLRMAPTDSCSVVASSYCSARNVAAAWPFAEGPLTGLGCRWGPSRWH